MLIYIGADHHGFELKENIKKQLVNDKHEVVDMGSEVLDENDDYPVIAEKVARKVNEDPQNSRGILLCGSGAGMDIVANRFSKVRSVLAINAIQVSATRIDDDTNVLCLAADYIEEDAAKNIVRAWVLTPFSGEERHKRRIREIRAIKSD